LAKKNKTDLALGQLIEAHKQLVNAGFDGPARVLALALLDRIKVIEGMGIIEHFTLADALVISQQVVDATPRDADREMVSEIVYGV